jgi:hypothetical protein
MLRAIEECLFVFTQDQQIRFRPGDQLGTAARFAAAPREKPIL